MKFFMMKRVMLAIALPVLVAYFGGGKVMSVYWVPLFFISAMLCATAYGKYVVRKNNDATFNYLNENNDGIYIHKFNDCEIRLDKNKKYFLKIAQEQKPILLTKSKNGATTLNMEVRLQVLV